MPSTPFRSSLSLASVFMHRSSTLAESTLTSWSAESTLSINKSTTPSSENLFFSIGGRPSPFSASIHRRHLPQRIPHLRRNERRTRPKILPDCFDSILKRKLPVYTALWFSLGSFALWFPFTVDVYLQLYRFIRTSYIYYVVHFFTGLIRLNLSLTSKAFFYLRKNHLIFHGHRCVILPHLVQHGRSRQTLGHWAAVAVFGVKSGATKCPIGILLSVHAHRFTVTRLSQFTHPRRGAGKRRTTWCWWSDWARRTRPVGSPPCCPAPRKTLYRRLRRTLYGRHRPSLHRSLRWRWFGTLSIGYFAGPPSSWAPVETKLIYWDNSNRLTHTKIIQNVFKAFIYMFFLWKMKNLMPLEKFILENITRPFKIVCASLAISNNFWVKTKFPVLCLHVSCHFSFFSKNSGIKLRFIGLCVDQSYLTSIFSTKISFKTSSPFVCFLDRNMFKV